MSCSVGLSQIFPFSSPSLGLQSGGSRRHESTLPSIWTPPPAFPFSDNEARAVLIGWAAGGPEQLVIKQLLVPLAGSPSSRTTALTLLIALILICLTHLCALSLTESMTAPRWLITRDDDSCLEPTETGVWAKLILEIMRREGGKGNSGSRSHNSFLLPRRPWGRAWAGTSPGGTSGVGVWGGSPAAASPDGPRIRSQLGRAPSIQRGALLTSRSVPIG